MTQKSEHRPPFSALLTVCLPPVLVLALAGATSLVAHRSQHAASLAHEQLAQTLRTAPQNPDTQAAQLLIAGDTAGLAAAKLQAQILDQVQLAGLQVQQIESKGYEPAGALTKLLALGTFQGTEAQLMAALIDFEKAEPLLFTDRLRLDGMGQEAGLLRAEIAFSAFAGQVHP